MARYTGPKTKISRRFGEPILGNGKWLDKNSNPPGMHGDKKKRKTLGEYALQLREKQKAKYTYGILEKQFRKTFEEAARRRGVLNGPSYQMKAGDVITIKEGSKGRTSITSVVRGKNPKFSWLDWNETELKGTFITYPERESVPENIKEQLIVELYSK